MFLNLPSFKPLWESLPFSSAQDPLLMIHSQPQVWSSYLNLWSLANRGGDHIVLVKSYEKEAFYRACQKWLGLVGLSQKMTKEGFELGRWGRILICYPFNLTGIFSQASCLTVANPFIFKRDYLEYLKMTLPENCSFWVFISSQLPQKKGSSATCPIYLRSSAWHTEIKVFPIPKRKKASYDQWALEWTLSYRLRLLAQDNLLFIKDLLENPMDFEKIKKAMSSDDGEIL